MPLPVRLPGEGPHREVRLQVPLFKATPYHCIPSCLTMMTHYYCANLPEIGWGPDMNPDPQNVVWENLFNDLHDNSHFGMRSDFSTINNRYEKARKKYQIPLKIREPDGDFGGVPQLRRTIADGHPIMAIIDSKFLNEDIREMTSQHAVVVSGFSAETIFASDPSWRREKDFYHCRFDEAWANNNYLSFLLLPLGTQLAEGFGQQTSLDRFASSRSEHE